MDFIDIQFARFNDAFEIFGLIALFFLIATFAETIWDFATRKRSSPGETIANVAKP